MHVTCLAGISGLWSGIKLCAGVSQWFVVESFFNRRSSEIQGTALGKSLRAWTCIYRSRPAGVAQSRHTFVGGYSEHMGKMMDTRKQKAEKASEMLIRHSLLTGKVQLG